MKGRHIGSRNRRPIALAAATAAALLATDVQAATRTWDGGGGASTLWSNAANWDGPDIKPVSGDDANIPGNFSITMNSAEAAKNVNIGTNTDTGNTLMHMLSGAALTIDAGGSFNWQGINNA